MANAFGIHHDPEYFKDPFVFHPERWIENPNLPFLTFGMGIRSCFGKKLAHLELRLMLYVLLKVCNFWDTHSFQNTN